MTLLQAVLICIIFYSIFLFFSELQFKCYIWYNHRNFLKNSDENTDNEYREIC